MKFASFGKFAFAAAVVSVMFSVSAFAANLGVVTSSDVNIRNGHSTDSPVIRQALQNELFTVTAARNSFYRINGGNVSDGYVSFDYFKIISADAQVAGNDVNIRKEPSTSAGVLAKLDLGTPITIVGQNDEWYAFKYNGKIAYISKDYALGTFINKVPSVSAMVLEPPAVQTTTESTTQTTTKAAAESTTQTATQAATQTESATQTTTEAVQAVTEVRTEETTAKAAEATTAETTTETTTEGLAVIEEETESSAASSLGEQMVSFAKQYIGTPYVYGGTNLNSGVDCSGFTSSIYKHFGISINRVSRDQISNGTPVSKENLRPGDLVFFNTGGNSGISHVGMYIGNGQYIHSTDAGGRGVTISELSNSYAVRTYYGACRVLA